MIRFTIPGEPQPWRRGRLGKLPNGKPRHFKDARTERNQASWAAAAYGALAGSPTLEGGLVVEITARFMVPASASKAKRVAMLTGDTGVTKRPDIDNIAKNLDGLNGVAFRDDAQVCVLTVRKIYAESAGVDFLIAHYGAAQQARRAA